MITRSTTMTPSPLVLPKTDVDTFVKEVVKADTLPVIDAQKATSIKNNKLVLSDLAKASNEISLRQQAFPQVQENDEIPQRVIEEPQVHEPVYFQAPQVQKNEDVQTKESFAPFSNQLPTSPASPATPKSQYDDSELTKAQEAEKKKKRFKLFLYIGIPVFVGLIVTIYLIKKFKK